MGARLKFWRRSRVPKKGSRDEAVEIPPARKPRYFEYLRTPVCRETDWSRAIHMSIMLDEPSRIFPNLGSRWQTGEDVHVK